MTGRPRRHATRTAAFAAILTVASPLVACDGGDGDGAPAPSTSASASLDEAAVRRQVIDTYGKWSQVSFRIAMTAADPSNDLPKYAAEPLLGKARKDLAELKRIGVVVRGQPTATARITSLRLDASPPTAALEVCVDTTHSEAVDKATGKSVESAGQLQKYKSIAAANQINGRWLIVKDDTQPTKPC